MNPKLIIARHATVSICKEWYQITECCPTKLDKRLIQADHHGKESTGVWG
jgi:hypothetical protein